MPMLIGRIVITTEMADDGSLMHDVEAVDAQDQELGIMESLGMLELAKDSLLSTINHDYDDDEDPDA